MGLCTVESGSVISKSGPLLCRKGVCKKSKLVCTIESGPVNSQNGSVYCIKWVCNKSKWACTVKSWSVKSQSGIDCTNSENGSVKGQSGSVLKKAGL